MKLIVLCLIRRTVNYQVFVFFFYHKRTKSYNHEWISTEYSINIYKKLCWYYKSSIELSRRYKRDGGFMDQSNAINYQKETSLSRPLESFDKLEPIMQDSSKSRTSPVHSWARKSIIGCVQKIRKEAQEGGDKPVQAQTANGENGVATPYGRRVNIK